MAENKNVVYKISVETSTGEATVRRLDGTIVATKMDVQALRKEFGNFSVDVKRTTTVAAKDFDRFNKTIKSTKLEQQGLSRATGGATTSVLELGRVVSDAPYGIRGMANNVSQLASNMLFTAQQVDQVTGKVIGFGGVLRQMGQTFLGPLGILFAIQAVVSALDYFYGGMKKAEKGVEGMGNSIGAAGSNLKILKQALEQGTISVKEANKAIEKANKEYKGLNLSVDENNKLTKDSVTAINDKIDALERLAKATAIQKKLEESYGKIIDAQLDAEKKLADAGGLNLEEISKKQKEFIDRYKEVTEREGKKFVDLTKAQQQEIYNGFNISFDQSQIVEEFSRTEKTVKDEINGLIGILNSENLFDELFKQPATPGGKTDKRDKAEGVGSILTAEELESARLKQAEQVSNLFEDKFNLTEENNKYLKDQAVSGLKGIANSEAMINAQRQQKEKEFSEARISLAELEMERKLILLDGIGAGLQAMSEIAGQETSAGKALAVAGATIDTYAAIDGQLAAFSGVPVPGYAIAQAVATGLFGFANIKKILAVKVPNDRGGGSGASAPSGRTFDFNLVGSTGVNQLAQTVGGQIQQPIKAYVVSSEVTNQQQFDNQIQGQATIG